MKFRRKPVVIEAVQITDEMFDAPHPNPTHLPGITYNSKARCVEIPTEEDGTLLGRIGDYIINDPDECGYYLCDHGTFEKAYEPVGNSNLTFGQAIEALKSGKKVARNGWNGKGMFLWLKPAVNIDAEWCKDPILKRLAEENGGAIAGLGAICMFTHDSTGRQAILTGWLASQSDMLLEDWCIVE